LTDGPGGAFARFAEGDEFCAAGPDGARAHQLLARVRADGAEVFATACESAVRRLLASGDPLGQPVLFDDAELGTIAEALSRCIASADLMGRARIRRRAEMAERVAFAESGTDDPFHDFADVPVLEPTTALEYFRRLVPSLGGSAVRYGPKLDRHAFTLAVASDQTILDKVKAAIAKQLQAGQNAVPEVQQVLDDAGVSAKNPQYADMVVRTNVLDAYNQGAQDEVADTEMQERFPAWEYLGVLDDRTGDDHRPKIGKYYPASAPFAAVRGPRVWNCRCSFAPVSKYLMNGIRVEGSW
jgi:SPP1 gp7 family putative phage head morphogenesis protein